jgi:hypothetical protein
LIGIIDPTGASDAVSGLLSLARGKIGNAAISAISLAPYIGDLAKSAKCQKYLRTIQEGIELAAKDGQFAAKFRPALQITSDGIERVPLKSLPQGLREQLERIWRKINSFLHTGPRRKYSSNPKHELAGVGGVKGSSMDLNSLQAESLLNDAKSCISVPNQRQFVGVKDGKIYAFQDDGAGGFHAYLITGSEAAAKYPKIAKQIADLLGTNIKRLSRMN